MKRLPLVLILVAFGATTAQAVTWMKIFYTEDWDGCRCVQEIEDGYIITGRTSTYVQGNKALWLFKTDTLGNIVWSKAYAGTNDTTGFGNFVQPTFDGGYIITGIMYTGFSQIWLLKTDKNGDTVWTRNFGKSVGHCVQQTQDGGYILTGRREWDPSRLFLLKTDSFGDSLWLRTYLPVGWSYSKGLFVEETDDNGYIVAGLIGYTEEDHYKEALWLIRTDFLGDTLWTYQGEEIWDYPRQGNSVRETKEGQYIALANFGLFKFDQEGNNLWVRDYRDGSCVQETDDEGYVLTGDGMILQSSQTSADLEPDGVWLLKTGEQGDSSWERTYTEGISHYLVQTRDRGFILTGQQGYGDPFLIKTDSLGLLGVTEEPVIEADAGWKIGSSIGRRIAVFYADLPQGLHARVYNVAGQQVDEIHATGNTGFITWGIGHPPGVYFIQAPNKLNQNVTAKVVIVR